jgi:hypothetical protein
MTKPFNTGFTSDYDEIGFPDSKIAHGNARALVYDGVTGKWFATWQDMTFPVVRRSVILARGIEDDWETVKLISAEASGGLLDATPHGEIAYSCVAYDSDLEELHVAWLEGIEGDSVFRIYHARCTDTALWNQVSGWKTYTSTKYQLVNEDDTKAIELACLAVDDTHHYPIVVWAQKNDNDKYEIYINVGDNGGDFSFDTSETTCISTSGGSENNHDHRSPACVCVWEEGLEIYVAWYHRDTSTPIYRVECKRLVNGDSWLTFSNWKGPNSGTTTADIIATASNTSTGQELGMAYWWDAGTLSQVFVAAILDGDIYTNWFDESGVYFGGGNDWNTGGGTALGIASTFRSTCSRVNANDFRVFYRIGSKTYFLDTDIDNTFFWPVGDAEEIFNNTKNGFANAELIGDQLTNDIVALLFVEDIAGYFDEPLWFIYTKSNQKPTVSVTTPKSAEGEDEQQAIYMVWNYYDPDGDTQDNYQFQVTSYGSTYNSPLYSNIGTRPDTSYIVPIPPNTLSTGSHYMWRVRVWDDNYGTDYGYNAESEWSAGTNDFWTTLPPVLEIISYEQLIETRWPRIDYTLLNNAEKAFSFGTAEYRIDASIWKAMTEKTGVGSEGLSGLSTGTPTPDSHVFYWDAETDEPGKYSTDIDIRMKGFVPSKDYPQWSDLEEELDGTLDTKAPVVSLTSPIDGDTLNDTTPEFIWPVATDDSALCASGAYLWQLDTVPTFNSGNLREYGWTNDLSYTVSLPLDQGMTYYWRIKARDKYHNIGESPAWHFNEEGVAITDYLRISGNQKIYKIHNFTLKVEENNAALLNGDLGEYTEGED